MKKALIAVVLASMLTGILAGCGKQVSDTGAGTTAQTVEINTENESLGAQTAEDSTGEQVTIRFAWWGGQERADKTNQAVELFMEKNPDIKVETSFFPFDSYYENLSVATTAGNMPDVWQGFVGSNNDLMEAGLVEPLDPYIEQGIIHVDDISEALQESAKINGKTYGIALGCNVKCLIVDPEAYEKAGLAVPEVAYDSWDALGEDLKKLKESGLQYGGDDMFVRGDTFEYFCRQHGEAFYSSTEETTIGFSKQTYVNFYNYRLNWIEQGLIPPYDVTNESTGPEDSQIAKGNSAVRYLYSSQYSQVADAAGKQMKLILLPGPNTEMGTDIRPGVHACMSSQSKNKEAAAKLIDFLVNDIDCNKILNAERGMPASSVVRDALVSGFDDNQKAMAAAVSLAEEHSSPSSPAPLGNVIEIDNGKSGGMMEDLEQQIMYGQMSPEDAFEQLEAAFGPEK